MNPLPLIELASQLPKRGKCVRKGFEVRKLFGLAVFQVLIGLILVHWSLWLSSQ